MWLSILALVAFNIVLGLALTILWVRNLRPQKDDPRLSKGLQLLQSKIAVLEDLSDRTDRQVKQLIQILEERAKGLQSKLLKAEEMMGQLDQSMKKSRDVANIFQDKIPHQEIIERQNTSKYVQAAKMANQGHSIDDICAKLGLPRSEAEFIAKVNKDELMFSEDELPDWMQEQQKDQELVSAQAEVFDDTMAFVNAVEQTEKLNFSAGSQHLVNKVFEKQDTDFSNLDRIRQDFRSAVDDEKAAQDRVEAIERRIEEKQKQLSDKAKSIKDTVTKKVSIAANEILTEAGDFVSEASAKASAKAKPVIQKVKFPRIDPDKFF